MRGRLARSVRKRSPMDKDYIAPQLSAREMVAAAAYVVLDTLFYLLIIGVPALVINFFSPSFPRRWKLGNALAVLAFLLLLSVPIALIVWLR
jgi:hypothetical protein